MEPSQVPIAEESPSTILFRPSKKRKIYRQRAQDDEDSTPATTTQASPIPQSEQSLEELITSNGNATLESDEVEGTSVPISEILRLRKRNKRIGGVEFKVEGSRARDGDSDGTMILRTDGEQGDEEGGQEVEVGGPRRFAPQTGTVGDVNRHM